VQSRNIIATYLKKLNRVTKAKIEILRKAKILQKTPDQAEEELAKQTRERFLPILRNVAKRASDLAIQSAKTATSIESMDAAINQLKREHLDLWKSFSALLAKYSSVEHRDSRFIQDLLHDYDLRRSYIDELIKPRGSSSVSIASTKLIIRDFADRFSVFLEQMNDYLKENYSKQDKKLETQSPFHKLKNSKEFREFYRLYKKYAEIKEASEEVTSGMESMKRDFEDVIELGAMLEIEMIEKLGYYVMFYDEDEGDFHGLTKELFKEFNVGMKKALIENMSKSVTDKDFFHKARSEFDIVWNKVVTREMMMMMEKEPIEILLYILEKKALRR
jgi:hypothetical protein